MEMHQERKSNLTMCGLKTGNTHCVHRNTCSDDRNEGKRLLPECVETHIGHMLKLSNDLYDVSSGICQDMGQFVLKNNCYTLAKTLTALATELLASADRVAPFDRIGHLDVFAPPPSPPS
ncbi:MAG: hypothetical protein HQL75_00595 [Magnetococcales bacterium]|nr:hypothetical protein [Magnetococcales bacterium]